MIAGFLLGAFSAGLVAWWARRNEQLSGLEFWVAALAFGLTLLVFELARLVRLSRPGLSGVPSLPNRTAACRLPAGTVKIISASGVETTPNLRTHRFHKYERSIPSESAHPTGLARLARSAGRSSPDFRGRWVIVSIFAGCDGRPWLDSEIAGRLDSLLEAGRWTIAEARRWRAELELGILETYFSVQVDTTNQVEIGFALAGSEIVPAEAKAISRALTMMSRCASQLGFRDGPALVLDIESRLSGWQCSWMLHVRRAGPSMAIPLELTELDGVSLAVCYACEASFNEPIVKLPAPDPVTFVHELLHLHGASDKYGVPLESFPHAAVSTYDVMRLDRDRLRELRVDPLTAAEIGWIP
jgi:hypothetical protein